MPWPSLLPAICALAIVGAGVLLAWHRWRKPVQAPPVLSLVLFLAAVYAGLQLINIAIGAAMVFSQNVLVNFPIQAAPFWPLAPDRADSSPQNVTGGFTHAVISADGLSLPTRSWIFAGLALSGLLGAALAALVALLCFRMLQRKPFAPELARLSAIAAALVLIAGTLVQVIQWVAGQQALRELTAAPRIPGLDAPSLQAAGFSLDAWPVYAALGLAALAALLRYGALLQRDTEGLV